MSKQRYLCIEGKKIPVSEEIYQVYYQFARKERYFSEDLKREKLLYDTEQTRNSKLLSYCPAVKIPTSVSWSRTGSFQIRTPRHQKMTL